MVLYFFIKRSPSSRYDITGFVGSIDGTLGLFIRFSFGDVIDIVLDYLKKALTTKRNEQQHHTATQNRNNGIESS